MAQRAVDEEPFLLFSDTVSSATERAQRQEQLPAGRTLLLQSLQDKETDLERLRQEAQDISRSAQTAVQPSGHSFREMTNVMLAPSPTAEPTREDFLQHYTRITLDTNTVSSWLVLSEGNRRVTYMGKDQGYPDHVDRFSDCWQVLSRESLTGRCYWELEWSGTGLFVAVCYRDIPRGIGSLSFFGHNDKSWALSCDRNSCLFWCNTLRTKISGRAGSRIGVFLDHRAGVLSFYSVSETMSLLHTIRTTFLQPLFAGVHLFLPEDGDTVYFPTLR